MDKPISDIPGASRLWRPRRVLFTKAALAEPHGQAIAARIANLGLEIIKLPGNRLTLDLPDNPRRAYAEAKSTLAVVVAPPSKLVFQPIAPSADWRVDLAEGCPAHCNYCYLAGSLKGPPITRAYANLDAIAGALPAYLGKGTVTSTNAARKGEGTTFEASCYTDPLGIEHLTGSLSRLIEVFGAWDADVQLRFTTKFAAVGPLLGLKHNGRTRMRVSLNPSLFARFEGGTSPLMARLAAMRQMLDAGYRIGVTIAPIIAAEGWQQAYGGLLTQIAETVRGAEEADLTIELITHRFTEGSKAVLENWYPGSELDMTPEHRTTKRNKFGGSKQVYDPTTMRDLRQFFEREIAASLPQARILYWT